MRRVFITMLILVLCMTQLSFAATDYYEYDSGNIKIPISDEEWSVFTSEDRGYWSENLDADTFRSVYSIFDSNDKIKFVAVDREGTCYWTFMPFGDGAQPKEFSSYSDSEWREFRLSFLSDDEVKEAFGDYIDSPGFDVEFDTIDSYNYQKYLVVAGKVTNNGQSLSLLSYLTIVNGYTYTFNLYLLSDDEEEATTAITKMGEMLWSVEFKPSGAAKTEETGNSSEDSVTDDTADRTTSLMTALLAVAVAAIALGLLKLLLSKKKKVETIKDPEKPQPEQLSDMIPEESSNKPGDAGASHIVYEDLKVLKELYDSGIITEEEYAAKKKQILGL